jgi:hypothetical protein
MTDTEILIDLAQGLAGGAIRALDDLSPEALHWRPDEDANSIALTAWHCCRALDVLAVRVLDDRPVEQELWYAEGWAAATGYDPDGKGWGGLGNLAGYTPQEVSEVPLLSAQELQRYLQAACEALCDCIERLPADALDLPASGWPGQPQSAYFCIRNFVMDGLGHLGEIKAIRAMWERRFGE